MPGIPTPAQTILEESGEHVAQPARPEVQGGPAAGEPSPTDATPPETPQELEWRWRNELRKVPFSALDPLAEAIGAPSRDSLVAWTQQGRDVAYHQERIRADEARLAQERRDLETRARQLEELQTDLEARAYGPASPIPGAPGYGTPTQPPTPQGGYGPASPYANPPAGYGAPGGYAPPAPPWVQGYPLPQDPQAREAMVLQALLSIPEQVRRATEPIVAEFRQERQAQVRGTIAARQREESAQLGKLADSYVEQLKSEGWNVDGINGEALIEDCNRTGLSLNPQLPWTEALEIAAARRLWRHGYQMGQGKIASDLETSRETSFRVPAAKPSAMPAPQDAPQGNTLQARAQRARQLGEGITMREALR